MGRRNELQSIRPTLSPVTKLFYAKVTELKRRRNGDCDASVGPHILRHAMTSLLEHCLDCLVRLLRCRVLIRHSVDTASLATYFLFGKLF